MLNKLKNKMIQFLELEEEKDEDVEVGQSMFERSAQRESDWRIKPKAIKTYSGYAVCDGSYYSLNKNLENKQELSEDKKKNLINILEDMDTVQQELAMKLGEDVIEVYQAREWLEGYFKLMFSTINLDYFKYLDEPVRGGGNNGLKMIIYPHCIEVGMNGYYISVSLKGDIRISETDLSACKETYLLIVKMLERDVMRITASIEDAIKPTKIKNEIYDI